MRKMILTAAATAAVLAFGAASASAECATHAGISKDGSLAPLQQPADGSADAGASGTTTGPASGNQANASGELSKDGSTAPLATEPGGGTGVATSAQDAQRQQDGQPTAAAQGKSDTAADQSC
jgi:hypothetical protein